MSITKEISYDILTNKKKDYSTITTPVINGCIEQ
jgi:hypothetical protein